MATPKVDADVGVNINPKGIEAGMAVLNGQMAKFIGQIETAGAKTNQVLKQLAITSKNLGTLSNFNAQQMLGPARDNGLGKQIRQMQDWQQGIRGASDGMQALRGRVAGFNVEAARLAKLGQTAPLLDYRKVENTAKAYGKVSNEIQGMRGRIALLSESGQKAFQPMLRSLDELDKKNARIFANPNLFDFRGETKSMQMMAQGMRERLVAREKIEQKTRLNIESLREEGRQLMANTRLEREAALAKAVRAGNTTIANRDLIGAAQPYRRGDSTDRQLTQINSLARAQRMLNAELGKPVEVQKAERIKQLTDRYKMMTRELGETIAMQNRQARQPVAPTGGFLGGLKASKERLFDGEGGAAYGAGALVGRVGAYALAAGAVYKMIGAITEGVKASIEYEDALAQLQAVAGSTGLEMDRLSNSIIEVARNSATSIMDLTKSATILAQAGYAGSEIPQMLESVVNLSDASGATADQSVEILTASLGAFQLAASESTRVTDILVNTLNRSKLSVQQVQLGLQYVGAAAKENNISLEQLTATLGTMADAGIRSGSTMSTGLRQMIVDFVDPSKKLVGNLEKVGLTTADIDIKTLGLVEVLQRLRDSGFQAYGALETRAAAAYQVLSTNISGIQTLQAAAATAGAAEEAQQVRLDSLAAKWQQIKTGLTEFAITVGNAALPALKTLADAVLVAFDIFREFGMMMKSITDTYIMFEEAITPASPLLLDLSNNTRSVSEKTADLQQAIDSNNLSMDDAAKLTDAAALGMEGLETASNDTKAEILDLELQMASIESEIVRLVARKEDLIGKTQETGVEVSSLSSRFPGLREEFNKTQGGIAGLISSLMALDSKLRATLQNKINFEMATLGLKEGALVDTVRSGAYTMARNFQNERSWKRDLTGRSPYNNRAFETAFNNASSRDPKKRALGIEQWNRLPISFKNTVPDAAEFFSAQAERGVLGDQRRSLQTASDANRYMNSESGQSYSRESLVAQGMAQRAASQGSAGGMGKAEIQRRIQANIDRNTQAMGRAGITDGERQARAEINAELQGAIGVLNNGYEAEREKEKKKKTGGGGGQSKAARDAERRGKELAKIDEQIAKEEFEYQKKSYENTLERLKDADSPEEIEALLDELNEGLTTYLESEKDLALQTIEKNAPTPEQKLQMLTFAGQKAKELRTEQIDKIADALEASVKAFIDVTLEGIERQYKEAMRFTERNLALAESRLEGLNDPLNNGKVPEYMKTLGQREVDIASARNREAQMGAASRRLEQTTQLRDTVLSERSKIQSYIQTLGNYKPANEGEEIVVTAQRLGADRDLRKINEEVRTITDSIYDQTTAIEVLKERYASMGQIPTTFSGGMRAAAQAMQIEIGQANSFGQELINNLDQPLRALHEGFKGFFSDMLSGSVTVGQAFKNLAGSVIDAINQMIAVALAKKFFSLILTAFGGSSPQAALVGDVNATMAANPGLFWNGGPITGNGSGTHTARRMWGGGTVPGGTSTRDSTLIHAAKGEYLLRRSSVQSIGKKALDAMNSHGINALKGVATPVMPPMPAAPPVNTSVYVIAPEEKPQMGPNDVVAAFSNDVLRGGITKKLIKRVASGG